MADEQAKHLVAVIGAGPAGLFAARELAAAGVEVVIFNRDIKPGGLAEYGIYPEKHKIKEGLRNQFHQILAMPNIRYYGNVNISQLSDLRLADLQWLGFQAILVAAGAQGTKWLNMPGEHLRGVYHAKEVVYHYNDLPPYSQNQLHLGRRVAIVGVGNVMTDIARYLITRRKVDEVIAIARRGPAEVKFDKKELEAIVYNLDIGDFDAEMERVSGMMLALGQEPAIASAFIHSTCQKAEPTASKTRFKLRFLKSPVRILSTARGSVAGLELESNTLVMDENEVKARSTGQRSVLDVDSVIFAIGDKVDDQLGMPVRGSEFVKNPNPRFPVEGVSYEVDSKSGSGLDHIFVAGWSRQASTGLVGIARRDGVNGARAVLQFLQTLPKLDALPLDEIETRLHHLRKPVVSASDLLKLLAAEKLEAEDRGLETFKYSTNEEMLKVMGID